MAYEESSESNEESADEIDVSDDEIESGAAAEEEEVEANDEKSGHHALEVRRAIEDHIERSRLQKEFDYLFDDKFTEEEEEDN